jgi:hypothetical protein
LPATITLPVRLLEVVFGPTVYDAVPEPVPDPDAVIQDVPVADVHVHPVCVVTVKVPLPPVAP